jgi:SAM-dependent methyltransferase
MTETIICGYAPRDANGKRADCGNEAKWWGRVMDTYPEVVCDQHKGVTGFKAEGPLDDVGYADYLRAYEAHYGHAPPGRLGRGTAKECPYMTPSEQGWMSETDVAVMVGFARLIPEKLGGILEVGCWRGRTTASLSLVGQVTAVDLFKGYSGSVQTVLITGQEEAFWKNVREYGNGDNVRILKGDSHRILPTLPKEAYRLILVDGDHAERAALQDMRDCWRLLAPGGYMFVDDRDHPTVTMAIRRFLDDHAELARQMAVVSVKLGYFYKAKP